MIKVPLSTDMTGYVYDPDEPTKESERLCFRLNGYLDLLEAQGFEIRLSEQSDRNDTESFVSTLLASRLSGVENPPDISMPENTDILLDDQAYRATVEARNIVVSDVTGGSIDIPMGEIEETLAEMLEVQKLELSKEEALYLSDGTPLFVRSGLL
jgi:hypothetical protein